MTTLPHNAATHLWCAHAAKLVDLPSNHRAALASLDRVVRVDALVRHKLIATELIPTVKAAADFNGVDPARSQDKLAARAHLTLALEHGLAPLTQQYALSTIGEAAEAGQPWAIAAMAHSRDELTVKMSGGGRFRSKAVRFSSAALIHTFDAPLEAVKALPLSTTSSDAATVRIVERWAAADWRDARVGSVDDERPVVRPARSLTPAARLDWLAHGRVPFAAVTLLVGDEGIGKSLFWNWLAEPVTTGKAVAAYGIPEREPAHVFIVATEDDWATSVLPRLEVAGADLDLVHVICTDTDGSGAPTFPRDIDVLAAAEVTPALVVVDAWLDTVPAGLQVRDPQQARQALHPWREYAASTRAAVLLLTHTNRVATANARDKYGITSELRKKARSTLFAQVDPDNADCVLIGPEKSNIAGQMAADRFRINAIQHFEPAESSAGTVPRLDFVESAGRSSRELISAAFHGQPDDENADSDLSEATAWLHDYLSVHGRTPSKDVKAAARTDGIKEHTIKRAASDMRSASRLEYVSEGFPRVTSWCLIATAGATDPYLTDSKVDEGVEQ